MNWSVSADFPTPPLPTMITLWSSGCCCCCLPWAVAPPISVADCGSSGLKSEKIVTYEDSEENAARLFKIAPTMCENGPIEDFLLKPSSRSNNINSSSTTTITTAAAITAVVARIAAWQRRPQKIKIKGTDKNVSDAKHSRSPKNK